jgi:hypothetical protein
MWRHNQTYVVHVAYIATCSKYLQQLILRPQVYETSMQNVFEARLSDQEHNLVPISNTVAYFFWDVVIGLIIRGFTSRSRIFHLYGDVTIAGEGLQNLGLCSLSREGSLSCHTCCDRGSWFFRSHSKDGPIWSPLKTHEGMRRIYSIPDPHGV